MRCKCAAHGHALLATCPTARSAAPPAPAPPQYVVSRRGLPESEARWFFQQLMLGMDYCHRKGGLMQGWGGGCTHAGLGWQREGAACLAVLPGHPRAAVSRRLWRGGLA